MYSNLKDCVSALSKTFMLWRRHFSILLLSVRPRPRVVVKFHNLLYIWSTYLGFSCQWISVKYFPLCSWNVARVFNWNQNLILITSVFNNKACEGVKNQIILSRPIYRNAFRISGSFDDR